MGDFTKANWAKWEKEEPAWFDEQFKASVDDDLLPAETLKAMVVGGGGNRRRSSIAVVLGVTGGVEPARGGGFGRGGAGMEIRNNQVVPEEHFM